MSDLARYFVFEQDGDWIIGFEGQVLGRYPSRGSALRHARVMADLMGAMHYDADVMLDTGGPLSPVPRRAEGPVARRRDAAKQRTVSGPLPGVLPADRSLTLRPAAP